MAMTGSVGKELHGMIGEASHVDENLSGWMSVDKRIGQEEHLLADQNCHGPKCLPVGRTYANDLLLPCW